MGNWEIWWARVSVPLSPRERLAKTETDLEGSKVIGVWRLLAHSGHFKTAGKLVL